MVFFINFIVFVFGLVIGSFLNCVIYRLEIGGSFLKGRSYCSHCQHPLSWPDLIPVFSFLILQGKCRYCQKPISRQYPLVEISTALIFLLISNSQFLIPNEFSIFNFLNLIYYWTIASFLIIIFVYDLKHYLIPDKIIYPAIAITFLYQLFRIWDFSHWNLFVIWDLGLGILPTLFFVAIVLFSQGKWLGVGDIKLAFLMGLILSFPNILVALFLAFFIGALVGVGLIIFNKKTLKSEIPFGPFLVTGTFLALFWGNELINWYQALFLVK